MSRPMSRMSRPMSPMSRPMSRMSRPMSPMSRPMSPMSLLSLSLSLLSLLAWGGARALVPPGQLRELSLAGSRRIDAEVEEALRGVGRMKSLMEQSGREHRQLLRSLEQARHGKEEAMRLARQKERELSERGERCNETALELWERCKPCLRQRCLRLYSRTCHSGAGLVGRQLEEFLNRSSPLSIWLDGERLDSLLERDQRQEQQLEELEERFGLLEDGVDGILRDSSRLRGRLLQPFFQAPFGGFREEAPVLERLSSSRHRSRRFSGSFFPFFQPLSHQPGFQQLFQPLFQMLEEAQGGWESSWGSLGSTESRNFSNDRMVCREIRRNSAGCLRLRDECEQCREILELDCEQQLQDPSQQELRAQLQDAVRLAERFTRRYDSLLREFQQEMLNTSGLLDRLNRQFGWVSRLANRSLAADSDGFLQVTTVLSKAPNPSDPSAPPDTQVTVQLFDSEPLELTVPGDIPWDHPEFMELVADQALRRFKDNSVE